MTVAERTPQSDTSTKRKRVDSRDTLAGASCSYNGPFESGVVGGSGDPPTTVGDPATERRTEYFQVSCHGVPVLAFLQFSAIASAWWFLLLIPLLVFYFLKLKRPRVEISSLVLWQSVMDDQRVNSPFQRFRRNLLLWLQLAILVLIVLAAMQPFVPAAAERATYLPVLIDCSASMAATAPESDESRLSVEKRRVRDLIENLLPGQRLCLIAMHSSAERLTEFTGNRRILLDALNRLEVREVASQPENAFRMAQALARTVPIQSIVVFSDGNLPERVRFALPFSVNYQQVPAAGPNAGITAFNARQSSDRLWDVFLRVEASDFVSGDIELWQDDRKVGESPFVLSGDESQRLTFSVVAETSTQLEARLVYGSGSNDSLSSDNRAWLDLPAARPLRVFAAVGLKGFRHALQNMPGVDLFPRDNQVPQRSVPYDLAIGEQKIDESLRAAVHVLVGLRPNELRNVLESGSGLTRFLDWDRSESLLQHTRFRDVEIADALQFAPGVDEATLEELGYVTIASGTNGPLIIRKRSRTGLRYHLLFHTGRSTLEFRVAFPVLVANAVSIARREASVGEVVASTTGSLPALKLDPETAYDISGPDGSTQAAVTDEAGQLTGVTAANAGRYEVLDGSELRATASVSLLSPSETKLTAVDDLQFEEQSVSSSDELLETDWPLWTPLTLVALALVLTEWWVFQRPLRTS